MQQIMCYRSVFSTTKSAARVCWTKRRISIGLCKGLCGAADPNHVTFFSLIALLPLASASGPRSLPRSEPRDQAHAQRRASRYSTAPDDQAQSKPITPSRELLKACERRLGEHYGVTCELS